MVMDAQTFMGSQEEACPEQLSGTRGKLPQQFPRCGCTRATTENTNKIISLNAKDVLGWADYPSIRQKGLRLN